jgi:predicted RNA-binding protein with RPS1 domain
MTASRRYPPATVPPDHPAAQLPRRRLAVLRPGMVVEGVITRLVRGGALVDIFLESGEPAFVPLNEIPHKAMPKVRELIEKAAMQQVRLVQLDRAAGTATASLHGLVEVPPDEEDERGGRRRGGRGAAPERAPGAPRAPVPAPPLPPEPKIAPPAPPKRTSASDRARQQQQEILRRLRGE